MFLIFAGIFVFLFGMSVGSFLNVLIWRLPRDEPIAVTRSYCPNCKKMLRWYELIPLLSFVWQGGRCRSCHTRISWQYPLVEFTTGVLFVFVFSRVFGFSVLQLLQIFNFQFSIFNLIDFGYFLFISSVLLVIFVTDLRYYIIPDKITFPAFGIVLLYNFFSNFGISPLNFVERASPLWGGDFLFFVLHPFWGPIIAGFFASLFFLSLVIASRGRWMGLGDVKLAFLMGLLLGFPNIFVALFLSFTLGSIVGILLIAGKRKSFSSQLPFGTFLTLATFIAFFWGDQLFSFYWNTIL